MFHALQCKLFSLSCDYWKIAPALLCPQHTFLMLLWKEQTSPAFLLFLLPSLSCILLYLRERYTSVQGKQMRLTESTSEQKNQLSYR